MLSQKMNWQNREHRIILSGTDDVLMFWTDSSLLMTNYIWCSVSVSECMRNGNTHSCCLHRDSAQGIVMNKFCEAVHSGLQGIKQRCHQRGSESFFSKNNRPWNEAEHKTTIWYIRQTHDMLSGDFVVATFHLTLAAYAFWKNWTKTKQTGAE